MTRSLSVVIILSVVALLSGCIISTTPKDNPVVLLPGQAKTFTIRVLPPLAKYAWYLGGNVVPGATGNSFSYMINDGLLPSDFTIEVRATGLLGTDKYTWNVYYAGTKPPQVSAGFNHTVGLKSDGTVVAVGYNGDGRCNVSDWTGTTQVSAGNGGQTVGLHSDGTVVAVGDNFYGQCNVSDWTGITQISAGAVHTVGLKSDGTVVAVGRNGEGECDVSDWTGITQVSTVGIHTVGLKSDGTVVAVGYNEYGQCNVGGWNLIVSP